MIVNPIIPIWLMAVICVVLIALKRKGVWPYVRQIIMVILLFVINLRIMVPGDVNTSSQKINANILFVIDNTISMVARDYNGDTERMEALKDDCAYIVDELNGAKFSVITFNNSAKLASPFTENTEFIKNCINSTYPINELYARGSSMNVSKDLMTDIVKRTQEKNDGKVIVFFISDGEITNEDKLASFKDVAGYIDGGAVLGYGTQKGGKMYVTDYFSGEMEVIEDRSDYPYKDAVSKIDEANLKSIAKDLGIEYINMNKRDNIDGIIEGIKRNAIFSEDEVGTEGYTDIYYIFVIPLLLMLIYEFVDLKMRGEK